MNKLRVLFVCIHNSARSQIAEAFLKQYGSELFEVESAGIKPGKLNQVVVKAMKEVGIDISENKTNSVADFLKECRTYDYVITVCDETNSELCPIFNGGGKKLHWGFNDPSQFTGTNEEKLLRTREVREQIEMKIKEWVSSFK